MVTLFGIPNCDTVKKARRWLDDKQITYRFHDFRGDGLEAGQIKDWLTKVTPELLFNKRSTTWKTLSVKEQGLLESFTANQTAAIALLVKQPTLIKRPVLQTTENLLVGFSESDYQRALS